MSEVAIHRPARADLSQLRAAVRAVEEVTCQFPQIEVPIEHYFAHHVYGRVMFMRKGAIITGAIHKFSQLNILMSGDVSVSTEDGMKRVQPPFAMASPPGIKRIMKAHEESVWMTVLGTSETDVDKIAQLFTATTEEEYIEFCKALESKSEAPCLS